MRTRARAWAIRAAVVAVVTAAGVVGIPAPAYAADVVIHTFSMNPPTIDAGQESKARFWLQLMPDKAGKVNLTVSSDNPNVECIDGCSVGGVQVAEGGSQFEAVFRANGMFASDETVTITVQAVDIAGGQPVSASQPLRVRATPTVPEVRGTVTDVYTGEPVKDARVGMVDSTGNTWDNIGTGPDGTFVITSVPSKMIAAGQVRFSVRKEGIRDYDSGPIVAAPDVPLLNVSLRVEVLETAAPTSAPATVAPTDLPSETAGPTSAPAVQQPSDSGLSGFAIMMIVIGGLLVLVGIAAIVLLFLRRNNDEDDDGPPGYGPGPGGRGAPGRGGPPPPPGQRRPGPPDRTQPMRPGYGGGPRPVAPGARDQTMIARSPLADAPTQLHRPGMPPQPPYGGPGGPPPPAGYPGPQPGPRGGPGSAPPAGYGQPPQYAGPPPAPAYGPAQPQPGYGPARPGPGGGYAEPRHGARPAPEGRRVDWIDD